MRDSNVIQFPSRKRLTSADDYWIVNVDRIWPLVRGLHARPVLRFQVPLPTHDPIA